MLLLYNSTRSCIYACYEEKRHMSIRNAIYTNLSVCYRSLFILVCFIRLLPLKLLVTFRACFPVSVHDDPQENSNCLELQKLWPKVVDGNLSDQFGVYTDESLCRVWLVLGRMLWSRLCVPQLIQSLWAIEWHSASLKCLDCASGCKKLLVDFGQDFSFLFLSQMVRYGLFAIVSVMEV